MYFQVCYLIRPKREFIDTLAEADADLAEYFDEPLIIDRKKERYPFGTWTEEEWNCARADEVKELFIRYIVWGHCAPRGRSPSKEVMGKLINTKTADKTDFDRWWTIERSEDLMTYESLESEIS